MGSTEVLSPEERVERVRMALAEAGYPDAVVYAKPSGNVFTAPDTPRSAIWRAYALVAPDELGWCWPCFATTATFRAGECDHDIRSSPWPSLPSDNQEPEP